MQETETPFWERVQLWVGSIAILTYITGEIGPYIVAAIPNPNIGPLAAFVVYVGIWSVAIWQTDKHGHFWLAFFMAVWMIIFGVWLLRAPIGFLT